MTTAAGRTATRNNPTATCKRVAQLAGARRGQDLPSGHETNKGAFTIELDRETAPCTSASFVSLANKGFFDGIKFHRIVPGFVIQGGDPTGQGTGGPGYSTVDVPPDDAKYTKGVVAMAKTQAEPAGTAGSQFFVVTAEDVRPRARLRGDRKGRRRSRRRREDRQAGRAGRASDRAVEIKTVKVETS